MNTLIRFMNRKLLYIEDDEIDLLAMKRVLFHFPEIELSSCKSYRELKKIDLTEFSIILCDSNLPDADYKILSSYLPLCKTHFVSGTIRDEVLLKPVKKEELESIFYSNKNINLNYIKEVSDGDITYEMDIIKTAIRILPERLNVLVGATHDLKLLKKAAHKAKSSYRVLGMENKNLTSLESLDDSQYKDKRYVQNLVALVSKQIKDAIAELTVHVA